MRLNESYFVSCLSDTLLNWMESAERTWCVEKPKASNVNVLGVLSVTEYCSTGEPGSASGANEVFVAMAAPERVISMVKL